jgi:uncharacterized membrane protein (UPF0127 family)
MNQVKINNNLFDVKTVISQTDIQNGMMGKKFNNEFNGMLFIMKPGVHSFWMKNCITPLDIIFIKKNKVNVIHKDCPPCKTKDCQMYKGEGDLVLEIKGGDCDKYDIKEGDDVYVQS